MNCITLMNYERNKSNCTDSSPPFFSFLWSLNLLSKSYFSIMSNSLKKKLMFDDDKIQNFLPHKRIAILDFDIDLIFFEDVAPALKYLESVPSDVVICDNNLNKMDSWKFFGFIKNLKFKGKFYFVSASILPGDRTRAAGYPCATNFFEKPIQETDLIYILSF